MLSKQTIVDRLRFEDLFSSKIKQLMYCYPIDKLNATGIPFWSGAKKPPSALEFDGYDPLHLEFIKAVSSSEYR
jgi:ubiquitin-activating enzyme E1